MSQSPNVDQLKKKAERLIRQPNLEQLREFENELSQHIGSTKEQPEMREQISQIKSDIYKKRREIERSSSSDDVGRLVRQSRFPEVLQAVERLAQREIIRSEHIDSLRIVLDQDPQMGSQIYELLTSVPSERLSGDAQILLQELNRDFSPATNINAETRVQRPESTVVSQQFKGSREPAGMAYQNSTQSEENTMNTGSTADEAMSKGDAAFYSGRIEEAATWYERALEIDPTRERARQRLRDIAEGKILQSAVPAEAGIAYGRALSMYRRGKYTEAAAEVQRAIDLMAGRPWRDAQELLNNCFSGQQAEEAYRDALKEEEDGDWPAALRDYDAAVAILPDSPIYAAARDNLKDLIGQANTIQADLRPARTIKELMRLKDVQQRIEALGQKSSSQMVKELQTNFDNIASAGLSLLEADINRSLAELSRRQNGEVETAITEVGKLLKVAELAEEIGTTSPIVTRVREKEKELQNLLDLRNTYENQDEELSLTKALLDHRRGVELEKATRELRRRFPQDPDVRSIHEQLQIYSRANAIRRSFIWTGGILLGLIILVLFVSNRSQISNAVVGIFNSPTPTPTLTPSLTPTFTASPTITPEPSATPVTPSPTPNLFVYARNSLVLREGCYSDFKAVAIPGADGGLLPAETRFRVILGPDPNDPSLTDQKLSSKPLCVYVQYTRGTETFFGFVLWTDVQQ